MAWLLPNAQSTQLLIILKLDFLPHKETLCHRTYTSIVILFSVPDCLRGQEGIRR